MPNVLNQMLLRELADSFADADGLLIVSLAGLTVAETEGIRNALAEHGVRLRMVRNRLAKQALAAKGHQVPPSLFVGNLAMAWGSNEDAIHAAQVVSRSQPRKDGKIAIKGGLLDGAVLDEAQANELATLPGRDELRAMMLGAISGPARMLVGLIAAPGASLARVLQAHIDQGEGATS